MAKEYTWKRLMMTPRSTVLSQLQYEEVFKLYLQNVAAPEREMQEVQITELYRPGFITELVAPQRNGYKKLMFGITVTRFGCFHNLSKDPFSHLSIGQSDHQETPVPAISPPFTCTHNELFLRQMKAEWGSNNLPRLGNSEMKHKIVAANSNEIKK